MKKSNQTIRMLSAAAKGMLHPGRKPAMEQVLQNVESIAKLVESDLLAVDPVRPYVVISDKIHILYMNDDRKYANFLYYVLSYINVKRGLLNMKNPVLPEECLDFAVVQTITRYTPQEGETWEDMPKNSMETLLVGAYQNGVVDYRSYHCKKG